jgi:hypothetical protein
VVKRKLSKLNKVSGGNAVSFAKKKATQLLGKFNEYLTFPIATVKSGALKVKDRVSKLFSSR